jgi:hypothetical protein
MVMIISVFTIKSQGKETTIYSLWFCEHYSFWPNLGHLMIYYCIMQLWRNSVLCNGTNGKVVNKMFFSIINSLNNLYKSFINISVQISCHFLKCIIATHVMMLQMSQILWGKKIVKHQFFHELHALRWFKMI